MKKIQLSLAVLTLGFVAMASANDYNTTANTEKTATVAQNEAPAGHKKKKKKHAAKAAKHHAAKKHGKKHAEAPAEAPMDMPAAPGAAEPSTTPGN